MREHAGSEAILCVCVEGQGFVRVGDQTSDLKANEAVVWPAQKMHQVWTEDSAMTILLIHFPGRSDLTPRDPSRL